MMRPFAAAAVAAAAAVLLLAACAPEPTVPAASDSPSPSTSASPSPSASQSPTPSPSATPDDQIALPGSCEAIYSASMLGMLNAQAPPLNHPQVDLHSTQNAELLEIQNSGIPTLRCTWGAPSEFGLATNVTIVDAEQSAAVAAALTANGAACSATLGGTICRQTKDVLTMEDDIVHTGETHFLRGNGWISTAWITFAPAGYTEDIAQTLWG